LICSVLGAALGGEPVRAVTDRRKDRRDLAARNRRTAGWLLAWAALLALASVAVIWLRN